MGMKPLSELLLLLRSTTARSFADRHRDQDLVLLEPYEKGRTYDDQSPLHAHGQVRFVPRTPGKPVPVGRDSRSFVLLDHPAVSRLHLVLAYTAEGWKAMDRSSNGCFFDEERLPSQQAVKLAYGRAIRMGRALVLRLFTLEEFHNYARGLGSGSKDGPPPPPPLTGDPQADTWRFPVSAIRDAAPPPAPAPVGVPSSGFGGEELEADFAFPDRPPGMPASPPTMRFPVQPQPPRPAAVPPAPPAPPRPPAAPSAPRKVKDDDIEFEFDFDLDGKGGFA